MVQCEVDQSSLCSVKQCKKGSEVQEVKKFVKFVVQRYYSVSLCQVPYDVSETKAYLESTNSM